MWDRMWDQPASRSHDSSNLLGATPSVGCGNEPPSWTPEASIKERRRPGLRTFLLSLKTSPRASVQFTPRRTRGHICAARYRMPRNPICAFAAWPTNGRYLRIPAADRVASGRTPAIWSPIQFDIC